MSGSGHAFDEPAQAQPSPLRPPPLVAIATPVYNGERFLEETMECVQAQTYPNLVHCVLDNASSDRTPEIIASFRNRRVPVIASRNDAVLPMIDNWNAALRLVPAEATYFRILPADDIIFPDGIRKMVELAERNPEVEIVGCQEWANESLLGTELPEGQEVFDGRAIVRGSLLNLIHGFPHLHCLYRKRPGEVIDRFYEPDFKGARLLALDMDAAMRVLSRAKYGYVHEPLVFTRLHDDSVTATEVTPQRIKMWSELQLIDRWGPSVFDSRRQFLACRRRHLRFYYRHLFLWRVTRQTKLVEMHTDWLRIASAVPSAGDYLRAVVEWPFLRLTRRLRAGLVSVGAISPYRLTS